MWGDGDGAELVRTAGEAARALAQRDYGARTVRGGACTVHVAVELVFGRRTVGEAEAMPSQQQQEQAGASEAIVRADPRVDAAARRRGDLVEVCVRSAVVDQS